MPFTLHRDHFVANRYAALAPAPKAATPRIYPATFPHDLKRRPDLAGEAAVYKALASAAGEDWQVFYNCSAKGVRRKIDFMVLIPVRGLIAIEVKGGLVHVSRGSFRQAIHTMHGQRGHRKRVEPFAQVKRALGELWQKTGIASGAVPTFIMAAFPSMSANAYPWSNAMHLLTREDFDDPARLARRLQDALPVLVGQVAALDELREALIANVSRPRNARRKS